ncbi:MAG: metalloregulator ArsR/SmtB family transcription factor [Candidatus Schekmanbacteria bacterium]|nr:metalloregulator ArsR/SmtB family transcription factor [Candidatus Schekmanbacteria bacterium]
MSPRLLDDNVYSHLSALAEPLRVRLLCLLEIEELSVGELGRIVQAPQSTISRHLKILEADGWLRRRTDGPSSLVRLAADQLPPDSHELWNIVRRDAQRYPQYAEDRLRLQGVLSARRIDSGTFFERVAGQWESLRNELFGKTFWLHTLAALLPAEWTIADLGCGVGDIAALIAPHVRRVIAIDREPAMLSLASRRLAPAGNVELRQGDLHCLPISDDAIDVALCVLVFHHIGDLPSVFAEISRVLVRGGKLVVVDMVAHDREAYRTAMGHVHMGFARDTLATAAAHGGMQERDYEPLPADAAASGPGLFIATYSRAQSAPPERPGPALRH